MTIRIIEDEPEIVMTRSEHARLSREYDLLTHMVDRPDFETWVRNRGAGTVAQDESWIAAIEKIASGRGGIIC